VQLRECFTALGVQDETLDVLIAIGDGVRARAVTAVALIASIRRLRAWGLG
jgi:hypothetical protein